MINISDIVRPIFLIFLIFADAFLVFGIRRLKKEGEIRAMWLFIAIGFIFNLLVLIAFWVGSLIMPPPDLQLNTQ